jgi:hypothetical protein
MYVPPSSPPSQDYDEFNGLLRVEAMMVVIATIFVFAAIVIAVAALYAREGRVDFQL